MPRRFPLLCTLLPVLLATACTTAPPRPTPAPVEERGAATSYPAPEPSRIEIPRGERLPVAPVPAAGSPAVVALLRTADEQQRAGQLDSAAASLERALRIEPGNAWLWLQLGRLRLQQQRWSQAEQMAQKSIRLATGDKRMQIAGWQLIAAARHGAGDLAGSRAAGQRVEGLR